MKVLRWIFGIPLACGIAVGIIFYVVTYLDNNAIRLHNYYLYLAFHSLEIIFTFGLLVFSSCLFVPRPKKYAALATIVIATGLVAIAVYMQIMNILVGNISTVFVISMLSLFAGLSIGLVLSFYVFKKRGWNATPKKTEIEITEIY